MTQKNAQARVLHDRDDHGSMDCVKTIVEKQKKKKETIKLWFVYMHLFFSFYFSALPKCSTMSIMHILTQDKEKF